MSDETERGFMPGKGPRSWFGESRELEAKRAEHESLVVELQRLCGVDKLPDAPAGTRLNERALQMVMLKLKGYEDRIAELEDDLSEASQGEDA